MGRKSVLANVETYFSANYTATAIAWDNREFDPETAGAGGTPVDEYVAIYVLPVTSQRELMGAAYPYKDNYIVWANVFVKSDEGPHRAYQLADMIETLFTEKTLAGGEVTYVPEVEIIGQQSVGASVNISGPSRWYQVAVKTPLDVLR